MKEQAVRIKKHTSGGVCVAIDSNLRAVVGAEEGAIESIPGSERRIALAWVNVRGGLRIFSVYIWHSEGWTSRTEVLLEAVLKRARTTRHPWLIACDANMCPEDFEKYLWFQRETMHVVALKGVSTCRSKGPKYVGIERTYDYVVASGRPKGKFVQLEVVEDFESRRHKAVSFMVERGKEMQEWNVQKLSKVLQGHSGGRLPGRSTKEKGREEVEANEGSEDRRIKSQIIQEVAAGIQEKVIMHDGVKNNVKRPVEQSFMQSWDCSHIENEEENESWREGDQMAAQWDEEQKLEDILERRRTEGSPVQLEVMHNATELFVHGMVYEENEEKTEYRNGGRY